MRASRNILGRHIAELWPKNVVQMIIITSGAGMVCRKERAKEKLPCSTMFQMFYSGELHVLLGGTACLSCIQLKTKDAAPDLRVLPSPLQPCW